MFVHQSQEESQTDEAGGVLVQMTQDLMCDVLYEFGVFLEQSGEEVQCEKKTFFSSGPVIEVFIVKEVPGLTCAGHEAGGYSLRCGYAE
jgi:hypothetical protein